jgi:hypothetical protein
MLVKRRAPSKSSDSRSDQAKIKLHLLPNFDRQFLPVPAEPRRIWWQDNEKTRNHAEHCQPLAMVNALGYNILSPATFDVEWNGDVHSDTVIEIKKQCSHCLIDSLSAFGSFTVQLGFIPTTKVPGDFIFIKGLPNERASPYTCMEALVEAWWSKAAFGIVFLMNQPGRFTVQIGQPIAQMFLYKGEGGFARLEVTSKIPREYTMWKQRRQRQDYRKDLDYFKGKHPDGSPEPTHYWLWSHHRNFRH